MKIFLDDIREPKTCLSYMAARIGEKYTIYSDKWKVVRNYNEFVAVVKKGKVRITHVSFDHDLAQEHYDPATWASPMYIEKTGLDCAKWLKNFYRENLLPLPEIFIHSMNPVGAEAIKRVFEKDIRDVLHDLVFNFKTKYKQGFTDDEVKEILQQYPLVTTEEYSKAFGINTCMIIDGEVINYHIDVYNALVKTLTGEDTHPLLWD